MKIILKTIYIILSIIILPIYVMAECKSVLFIGNSFTHMNNFSEMVANIAIENCDTLITDFAAIDSYTLEKHFNDENTISKINSQQWDFVVLQEQSQRPVMDSAMFYGKTLNFAKELLKIIYANNPNTQPLLFMTWGYKYGDTALCKKLNYTCTYEGMQNMLIERYNLLGELLELPVVPCGKAWLYFAPNASEHINLFYPDNKHPNEVGSYLNACVFYSFITKHSPVGVKYNPAILTKKELLEIQITAYNVCND